MNTLSTRWRTPRTLRPLGTATVRMSAGLGGARGGEGKAGPCGPLVNPGPSLAAAISAHLLPPRTADPCSLPLDEGACTAYTLRWYHRAAAGGTEGCHPFVYGGCGGNANRFGTREACERRCPPQGAQSLGRGTGLPSALAGARGRSLPRPAPGSGSRARNPSDWGTWDTPQDQRAKERPTRGVSSTAPRSLPLEEPMRPPPPPLLPVLPCGHVLGKLRRLTAPNLPRQVLCRAEAQGTG